MLALQDYCSNLYLRFNIYTFDKTSAHTHIHSTIYIRYNYLYAFNKYNISHEFVEVKILREEHVKLCNKPRLIIIISYYKIEKKG